MLTIVIVVLGVIALESLAWRYGADSRDGRDWTAPHPVRQSPRG